MILLFLWEMSGAKATATRKGRARAREKGQKVGGGRHLASFWDPLYPCQAYTLTFRASLSSMKWGGSSIVVPDLLPVELLMNRD